ncbi:heterokaryon incompatibility protein-domain-containing protein [Dactylonectria macrodidyma]|uniref:Heterokaryon incompatibility protein-domain-containing protein n=1 Tax=Dactylonectria macrodidyma TaxID=307937 RepID=A0A9P9F4A1_9HYPO|nr:heterokaryon incompatibility protein-domain-containing protein [Dactylonectria macrodidyma]
MNNPRLDDESSPNALWLGQAPNSPYQLDEALTSSLSCYDGNSASGEWPTLGYTKAHRLHDIKTLCDACDRLDITKLTEGGPSITLRDNYVDIVETAKECRLCSLIAQQTRGVSGYAYKEDFRYTLGNKDAPPDLPVCLALENGQLDFQVPLPEDWEETESGKRDWDLGTFSVCTEKAAAGKEDLSVADKVLKKHPVPISASPLLPRLTAELQRIINSPACRMCASQYTQPSSTGSQSLPKDQPPILPDRVIEILDTSTSESIHLRLLETHGTQFGSYIALSHRWGGALTLKTTKDTFTDRLNGFRLMDLPRTFQDTVLVAKALGIKHLWIDSLCIVQDDRQEWLEQSAKMGSIYMNSTFTIAAHSAGQCNEGFLWRSQVASTLHISPKRGGPDFVLSLPDLDEGMIRQRFLQSEISRRAWILQELTLSPRILHFVENRLFWECEHRTLEIEKSVAETTAAIFRQAGSEPDVHTMWLKLVSRYTEYAMTKSGDKLVALAGVVEVWTKMINRPEDRHHHCGVFHEDIERSLLWYGTGEGKSHPERAPSWSWASIDGTLHFLSLELDQAPRRLIHVKGVEHQDYLSTTTSRPSCRLLVEAPVIRVTGGFKVEKRKRLKVTPAHGPRWMTVVLKNQMEHTTYAWCIHDDTARTRDSRSTLYPTDPPTVSFVAVSGREVDGELVGAWCIIVTPEDESLKVYRRIGMGYVREMEAIAPAVVAPEVVTLV